jgi:hypothetical protein
MSGQIGRTFRRPDMSENIAFDNRRLLRGNKGLARWNGRSLAGNAVLGEPGRGEERDIPRDTGSMCCNRGYLAISG